MKMLLSFGLMLFYLSVAFANPTYESNSNVVDAFIQIDPYMSLTSDNFIVFNSELAHKNNVNPDYILLAEKYVLYQNELISKVHSGSIGSKSNIETLVFQPFFEKIQETGALSILDLQNKSNENIRSSHTPIMSKTTNASTKSKVKLILPPINEFDIACGGGNESPHACPARPFSGKFFSSSTGAKNYLLGLGYHNTYYPGCGVGGYSCPNDFSQNVTAYSCGGGVFRKQAYLVQQSSNWTYWTQSPEPNPEILSYVWPAWWWAGYVRWWHTEWVQPNGQLGC